MEEILLVFLPSRHTDLYSSRQTDDMLFCEGSDRMTNTEAVSAQMAETD